jgi:hypothetical protein
VCVCVSECVCVLIMLSGIRIDVIKVHDVNEYC